MRSCTHGLDSVRPAPGRREQPLSVSSRPRAGPEASILFNCALLPQAYQVLESGTIAIHFPHPLPKSDIRDLEPIITPTPIPTELKGLDDEEVQLPLVEKPVRVVTRSSPLRDSREPEWEGGPWSGERSDNHSGVVRLRLRRVRGGRRNSFRCVLIVIPPVVSARH